MKPIVTLDFETDPFKHGRVVEPFCVGLYDGSNFNYEWGADCAAKIMARLSKLPESIIYIHNGGRFDLFFLFPWIERQMRIINGRIVQCYLDKHEVRDSYSIFPLQLAKYKKDDIDITHLERDVRQKNKDEILSYLRGDCVYLHELVSAFIAEFGDYLTIGSAAMHQLRSFHPFRNGGPALDEKFRHSFFYGGRVQCFKAGVIKTPFQIFDVNSMYPHVMKNYVHPCATAYDLDTRVTRKTFFVVAEGKQLGPYGAFPTRDVKGSIGFKRENGTFCVTIHEWNAALECGYFKPLRVIKTYNTHEVMCFDSFVDHFFSERLKAKESGDKLHVLFYKLILNSAYGKFAQNPDNFKEWSITHDARMAGPWTEHFIHQNGQYTIWKKPTARKSYYNVCIAASITGAARAVLMRAIRHSTNPLYCDTDSLACRSLAGVEIDDSKLGAWALETQGDTMAIAGKKIYACFADGKCVKKATKGAKLSAEEIVRVAQGETVTYHNAAPTFKLDGRVEFLSRRIKRTV